MRTLKTLVTIISLTAAAAHAQPRSDLVPVDQAVADLDTLATSLRQVQTGLRTDGEQTSLFVLRPPQADAYDTTRQTPPPWGANPQPVYYRIGPGVRARVNRMDYLIRTGKRQFKTNIKPIRDGQFFELIPANTVFDLAPLITPATPLPAATDRRLDGRINLRLNSRVDGKTSRPPP